MEAERRLANECGVFNVAHGFITARNPVTCARQHVGPEFVFTAALDLANWFDSITSHAVDCALYAAGFQDVGERAQLVRAVTYKGSVPQGFPTSPVIANLCAVTFDEELASKLEPSTVYTRYADDLTFSCVDQLSLDTACLVATETALAWGWHVAAHKTKIYKRIKGRRAVVVGISVGATDIRATRHTRRRLRAARHHGQSHYREANGLSEWAACKLPRALRGLRGLRLEGGRRVAAITAPVEPVLEEVIQPSPGATARPEQHVVRPFRRLRL